MTNLHPVLIALGLTPEIIARHVVSVDRRPAREGWEIRRDAKMRKIRAARKAAGLNVLTGLPLRRSPNGTRKIYRRGAEAKR